MRDQHYQEQLDAEKFVASTNWAWGRTIVPLPGTFGSALPETATGTGKWNKKMIEARHKIQNSEEYRHPLDPDRSLNPSQEQTHSGEQKPFFKKVKSCTTAFTAQRSLQVSAGQLRNRANQRRRAPRENPFKEFLEENVSRTNYRDERFAKQAKALAADPRLLQVYMAAMKSRSQNLQDRERSMDEKTLFENAKLFHGSNYRALGRESLRFDWEGTKKVRDLIMDVKNEESKSRRKGWAQADKFIGNVSFVNELKSNFAAELHVTGANS